jgi:hypothetical protein
MAARVLYARGVDMVRVEMIPDVKEDIVASVRALSKRVGPNGFVFTSGGIGVRPPSLRLHPCLWTATEPVLSEPESQTPPPIAIRLP